MSNPDTTTTATKAYGAEITIGGGVGGDPVRAFLVVWSDSAKDAREKIGKVSTPNNATITRVSDVLHVNVLDSLSNVLIGNDDD
jgi:hypothetical protein